LKFIQRLNRKITSCCNEQAELRYLKSSLSLIFSSILISSLLWLSLSRKYAPWILQFITIIKLSVHIHKFVVFTIYARIEKWKCLLATEMLLRGSSWTTTSTTATLKCIWRQRHCYVGQSSIDTALVQVVMRIRTLSFSLPPNLCPPQVWNKNKIQQQQKKRYLLNPRPTKICSAFRLLLCCINLQRNPNRSLYLFPSNWEQKFVKTTKSIIRIIWTKWMTTSISLILFRRIQNPCIFVMSNNIYIIYKYTGNIIGDKLILSNFGMKFHC